MSDLLQAFFWFGGAMATLCFFTLILDQSVWRSTKETVTFIALTAIGLLMVGASYLFG